MNVIPVMKSAEPVGDDFADDIVTACYLCFGQCNNFGNHGNGIRPCAKGMTDILSRRREARLQARTVRQSLDG